LSLGESNWLTGRLKTGLDETGLDETGLDETGLDETGLDETGLDETGLGTDDRLGEEVMQEVWTPYVLRLE